MGFFVELVATPTHVVTGGTPSPRPPYVSPPSITPARPHPKGGGLLRARISGQIFRPKFQDPSYPKKSQKIPLNNINPFSTKNFKNKIPANFPIYYLANSHISKKNLPNSSKTLFSLGGGGLFLKGYLREKIFPENFSSSRFSAPLRA